MLKIWSTHYGEVTFAVLTADCTREVYFAKTIMYSMHPSGCTPEGWQPDGTLLMCSNDPSANRRLDPDTGNIEIVCRGRSPDFSNDSIQWAPDGQRLAMIASSAFTPATLYVVDVDGSHLVPLAEVNDYSSLDWSPDGKRIVYTMNVRTINVVDTDGTHQRELTAGYDPHWSPDGRTIAFRREDGLYSINPDGSNLALTLQANISSFAWSPDGSHIAIVQTAGQQQGPEKIVIIPAQPSADQHVTISDQLYVDRLAWSPDGKKIAFTGNVDQYRDGGVYLIGSDGSGLRKFTDNSDGTPSWGPDGETLVFAAWVPDGKTVVSIRNLKHGTARNLDYEVWLEVALSPDGQTIAMVNLNKGKEDFDLGDPNIYLGNIDGRPLVNLTEMLSSQFKHPCR
jgi:Tol biopolymer transport system component